MSKPVFEKFNFVQHTWPVSDDVDVYLTVRSKDPLPAEAYAAIGEVVVAGSALSDTLKRLAVEAVSAPVGG